MFMSFYKIRTLLNNSHSRYSWKNGTSQIVLYVNVTDENLRQNDGDL